jgi:uncharacterized protein (TIGR00251 family)
MDLEVRVQPRASRESVGGLRDGALEVRVTAPPADGRANAAVCRLVARAFGVRPGAVQLVSGAKSRRKRLRIEGENSALEARLRALASGRSPA